MVIFFILLLGSLKVATNMISKFIDKEIKDLEEENLNVYQEFIKCEISYKDINYNGFCFDEVKEGFEEIIGADKQIELLQICMSNPYAHRFWLCEELM